MTTIHIENLIIALEVAIAVVSKKEEENNCFSDSALLAGWKQIVEAYKNNEQIHIKY